MDYVSRRYISDFIDGLDEIGWSPVMDTCYEVTSSALFQFVFIHQIGK